jgi:hypothetical protein
MADLVGLMLPSTTRLVLSWARSKSQPSTPTRSLASPAHTVGALASTASRTRNRIAVTVPLGVTPVRVAGLLGRFKVGEEVLGEVSVEVPRAA